MRTLKKFISGVILLSPFIFAMLVAAYAEQPVKGIKNIVLVHGAYADGSSWAKVITLLQQKGYHVIAVQNPLTSLEDDVAATRRAIDLMDGPVLLGGHSSAGMVITEAGNDPKVKGLVYASALIPNDGQSVGDVVEGYPSAGGNTETREDPSGFLLLSEKGINENFVQDLSPAEQKIVYATQGPWGKKFLTQRVTQAAWKSKPSWCIIASEDRSINPQLERAEAVMIKARTLELRSGHVSMLSHPKEVAAFIMSAATSIQVP
jgi:pimeloyl-ACP methyl ester carboxylesterase